MKNRPFGAVAELSDNFIDQPRDFFHAANVDFGQSVLDRVKASVRPRAAQCQDGNSVPVEVEIIRSSEVTAGKAKRKFLGSLVDVFDEFSALLGEDEI